MSANGAASASAGAPREAFLRRALLAGGTLTLGGVAIAGLPRLANSAPSPAQDVRILNLVLLLEYVEADFYAAALDEGQLTGELRQFATVVGGHERAHVAFLEKTLGSKAREKPDVDFGDSVKNPTQFVSAAMTLEDLGVAAYNGQAANLTKGALAAAARIVSVEARHAAWIRFIAEEVPAPRATDLPATEAEVNKKVSATGFVKS